MSTVEGQLRDLMQVAVGEPPHRVTVAAVRRRVIRRRVVECVSGMAALVLLAGAGVAVAAGTSASHPPAQAVGSGPSSPPPYYVQVVAGPQEDQLAVRSTATGRVTAHIASPWPGAYPNPPMIAAAGNQTFYVVWAKGVQDNGGNIAGSRIYRFQLTAAGKVSGYQLAPGGDLGAQRVGDIAASASGSLLAVAVTPGSWTNADFYRDIEVINTRTGTPALWRNDPTANGTRLDQIQDLVLAQGGSELAFLSTARCTTHAAGCSGGFGQLRVLSSPAAGGEVTSGQIVFRQSELTDQLPRTDQFNLSDALLNPDGSTIDAVVNVTSNGKDNSSVANEISVLEIPVVPAGSTAATRPLVLYRLNTGDGFFDRSFSVDPTGQYLLFNEGPTSGTRNGWIRDGRLVPLAPANGSNYFYEGW